MHHAFLAVGKGKGKGKAWDSIEGFKYEYRSHVDTDGHAGIMEKKYLAW